MKTLSITTIALLLAITGQAAAGDLTKEQCVDAHSRGQDAKEQGKLSLARKLFLTCAQSACPAAVQGDCARFADDLTSLQPTIVLVARDGNGNDLPNTSVYIDGALIATTLDGRPLDIDPGNHSVRFTNGIKDEVVTVVIGSGEKGRTVQARFGAPTPSAPSSPAVRESSTRSPPPPPQRPRTTHPSGSLAMTVIGAGLALTGAAVGFYGTPKIPSSCSLSTNECSAPPGDEVFGQAASGARTMNIGIAVGAIGVATFAGGLVWYFAGAKTPTERSTQVAPIVTNESAGFALSGRF